MGPTEPFVHLLKFTSWQKQHGACFTGDFACFQTQFDSIGHGGRGGRGGIPLVFIDKFFVPKQCTLAGNSNFNSFVLGLNVLQHTSRYDNVHSLGSLVLVDQDGPSAQELFLHGVKQMLQPLFLPIFKKIQPFQESNVLKSMFQSLTQLMKTFVIRWFRNFNHYRVRARRTNGRGTDAQFSACGAIQLCQCIPQTHKNQQNKDHLLNPNSPRMSPHDKRATKLP